MLELNNIKKTFNKGTPNEFILYDGLSLKAEVGDHIVVVGSNGSGKSTLLNVIAGSVYVDSGSVVLNKIDVTNKKEYIRAQDIGRVFQDPKMGTCSTMTIMENMSLAYNKGNKYGMEAGLLKHKREMFKDMLRQLGISLEEKMETKAGALSGGQRQALALLMATMGNPKLLLLDEHAAALDPKTSAIVLDLTESFMTKDMTSIMVTHNLADALAHGNRLLMLHKGKVLLDIKGEEKKKMTIEALIHMFSKEEDVFTDTMLF